MHASDIATIGSVVTIIIGTVGIGGFLYAIAKWVGRVDANTAATIRLTTAFEKHADVVDTKLGDHEHRITILETKAD